MANKDWIVPTAIVGAIIGVILFKRKKAADEGEGPQGRVRIEIIPGGYTRGISRGIAGILPPNVIDDPFATNIVRVFVTNTSKRAGSPVAYTFTVVVGVSVGTTPLTLHPGGAQALPCDANAVDKSLDFEFTVPAGVTGAGTASVWLFADATATQQLGTANTTFTVTSAAVIPGGTIRF